MSIPQKLLPSYRDEILKLHLKKLVEYIENMRIDGELPGQHDQKKKRVISLKEFMEFDPLFEAVLLPSNSAAPVNTTFNPLQLYAEFLNKNIHTVKEKLPRPITSPPEQLIQSIWTPVNPNNSRSSENFSSLKIQQNLKKIDNPSCMYYNDVEKPEGIIAQCPFNNHKEDRMRAPPGFKLSNKQPDYLRFCVFCRQNGEQMTFWTSHCLKDYNGNVVCPILRSHTCTICGATGSRAHTIKHCPLNTNVYPSTYKQVRKNAVGKDVYPLN